MAALLLLVAPASPSLACTIRLVPYDLAAPARVAAIEIMLKHAAVASLSAVPAGWRMAIDNDPSWSTRIAGHAVVGAAFLGISELVRTIATLVPEPGHTCGELRHPGAVSVRLTVYQGDRLREIVLPLSSFRIAD